MSARDYLMSLSGGFGGCTGIAFSHDHWIGVATFFLLSLAASMAGLKCKPPKDAS